MNVAKGNAGYIRTRKKKILIKTICEFGIVVALLILGIVETGSRQNLLTVVAVLGCLPASKALVELIIVLPHRSITKEKATEIEQHANQLTRIYDMVFTSEKKIMPVDAIVISGNTICGYSSNVRLDANFLTKHLKQYLYSNQFNKVSVKIYDNYTAFLTRTEEMNHMVAAEKVDAKRHEEGIRKILLNISL